ncbi:MAG: hypothetical protein RL557_175 [archaeon]|jgi:hypothetical protein
MPKYCIEAIYLGPYLSSVKAHRYRTHPNLEVALQTAKETWRELFKEPAWPEVHEWMPIQIVEVRLKHVGRNYKWHSVHGNAAEVFRRQKELDDEEERGWSQWIRNNPTFSS